MASIYLIILIEIAKKAIPSGFFSVGEAKNLEIFEDNSMDYIIVHSCAQYFPNNNYLKDVIGESLQSA